MTVASLTLNTYTEGDARDETHAKACREGYCMMCCRCWCHGITHYPNGDLRPDAG